MKAFLVGVLCSGLLAATAASASAATTTVSVGSGGDRFSPSAITITQGDTVTWSWADGGHNVVSRSGPEPFRSPLNSRGATWSRQFTAPGTYTYVCEPHDDEMRGTITVNAAPQPTPGPTPEPTPEPQPTPQQPSGSQPGDGGSTPGGGGTTAQGASTSTTAPPGPAALGAPAVQLLSARLERGTARLTLNLSEAAKVVVGLRRLGGGRRVVRTRRRAVRAGRTSLRVALRGLPRGRYRLRVVAVDADGQRSPARVRVVRHRR